MAIVAVTGDLVTTTSIALALGWPTDDDPVVVEADPAGGDLAAWLDIPVHPSLSTVITRVADGSWPEIEPFVRDTATGVKVIPLSPRAVEAARSVAESARSVVVQMASPQAPTMIVDTGRLSPNPAAHPFVAAASVVVLVHRQTRHSNAAAAVRLQRLADQVDLFASSPGHLVVAVVGNTPFSIDDISHFLADTAGALPVIGLPYDELAASVWAGRDGVSARRANRLPLYRAGRDLALIVHRHLDDLIGSPGGSR
ncbi:MAG: hypothetical protein CSA55_01060 [Ilumatobacter coccineus]|uniref:Uncharacterized protein n=1 Tax=Ilumatobacter coccineus TaxID=467094 RepID=A0A2G6KFC9_9ACTN|nr:MAG: hypothetical protein CSA55_01060 [Ilumatobacter coccineus]